MRRKLLNLRCLRVWSTRKHLKFGSFSQGPEQLRKIYYYANHISFQGSTDRLLLRRNAAQAHFSVKTDFHQLDYIPITHAEPPTQIADHRLGAWPETTFWHIFRPASIRLCSTGQAGQSMALIFRYHRFRLGQFTDLMPLQLRIISQQQGPTLVAGVWFAYHDALNWLRRFQLATLSVMSLLPAGFSSRGFAFGPGRHSRPIRRGRFGRVLRMLVDLLPQSSHLCLQPANLFLQHGDLGDNQPLYQDWYSFPISLGNRQTRRQFHIHSLLLDLPFFYC